MNQKTLIITVVLVLLVLGGAGYWWTTHPDFLRSTSATPSTSVASSNSAHYLPANPSLPTEVKGDTPVVGTLNVGTVKVTVSSLQKPTTDGQAKAEAGQTFLIVYIDPVAPADTVAASQGLRDATVSDGKNTYPMLSLKVASTYVKNDRGTLKFSVPLTAKNLQLVLGSGATKQTISLP